MLSDEGQFVDASTLSAHNDDQSGVCVDTDVEASFLFINRIIDLNACHKCAAVCISMNARCMRL